MPVSAKRRGAMVGQPSGLGQQPGDGGRGIRVHQRAADGGQFVPQRRYRQRRDLTAPEHVGVHPRRHGLQLLQQRGDGRRTLGQALQAVGKTGIEDATAFLAERVHFDNDRVRQRVTNRQHPDRVVSLVSMPGNRLVQVDYATRNFRALMCRHSFKRAGIGHFFLRNRLSEAQQKRALPLKPYERCCRRAGALRAFLELTFTEKPGPRTLDVVRIRLSQPSLLEPAQFK
jgi:hypothetical protein